jgi:hypothetical protein
MVTSRPSSLQPAPVPLRPTERIGMANLARARVATQQASSFEEQLAELEARVGVGDRGSA